MSAEPRARLVFEGTALGVRDALRSLCNGALRDLGEADRGIAQIVLAETLNNVVEHAYAGGGGEIALDLWLSPDAMRCLVTDKGRAMPRGGLPAGQPPHPGDLPEGGFGWFLIRSLATELRYRRVDGCNELAFSLPRRG